MEKLVQVFSHYTGQSDDIRIIKDGDLISSVRYAPQIIGKPKCIIDKYSNVPVFTFHSYLPNGSIENTFFVKGSWYFTSTNFEMMHISSLGSIFGQKNISQITFSGLHYKQYYGFVELVGVDDYLYMTDDNHVYQKIGPLHDYVPEGINFISIWGTALSGKYIAFHSNGQAFNLNSFDISRPPTIVLGSPIKLPWMFYSFRATGCYVEPTTGLDGNLRVNFINKSFGLLRLDFTSSSSYNVSSTQLRPFSACKSYADVGVVYQYQIKDATDSSEYVAMISNVFNLVDSAESESVLTYNEALQLTSTKRELISSYTPTPIIQTVEQGIEYLWESSQSCANTAAEVAKSFIARKFERITQQDVSHFIYNNSFLYNSKAMQIGRGVYYVETSFCDGLIESENTQQEKYLLQDASGAPTLIQGILPFRQTTANVRKYIYTRGKSTLPIASFSGVLLGPSNSSSAHYLGFEPYEEFEIQSNNLNNSYFSAQSVELINTSFLGSNAMRFARASSLNITDALYISADTKYQLSFWYRESNDSPWMFKESIIDGSTLKTRKVLYSFTAGQAVTHITIKPLGCVSQITIYDPETLRIRGRLDNQGVPTQYIVDKLGRILFSYKHNLIPSNNCFSLSQDFALSTCAVPAYARFNRTNCARTPSLSTPAKDFNSTLKLLFSGAGFFLHADAGVAKIGGESVFIAAAWAENGQAVQFVGTPGQTVEVRFTNSRVSILQNDSILATSEEILDDASSWMVLVKRQLYIVVVNGKPVISQVINGTGEIDEIKTYIAAEINKMQPAVSSYIVVTDFDYEIDFQDYNGNIVQEQRVRNCNGTNLQIVANANFYDEKGNIIAETLRGAWPNSSVPLQTSDSPLDYKSDFASINWSDPRSPRGILTGSLKSYYENGDGASLVTTNEDYKWPYVQHTYEQEASNRRLSSIWQGKRGETSGIYKTYHSLSTFNQLMTELNPARTYDYYSISYRSDTPKDAPLSLDLHTMINSGAQQVNKSVVGTVGDSTLGINYAISEKLINQDTNSTKGALQQFFAAGQTDVIRSSFTSLGSNRIHTVYGEDYHSRTILYDSYGNARLASVTETGPYIYAKYDIQGRITECGEITLPQGKTLIDYYSSVNNPSWPSTTSLKHNPLYLYTYDYSGNTLYANDIFSRGKLVLVVDVTTGNTTSYQYDYLGRTKAFSVYANDLGRLFKNEYVYDCLGNIKSIDYSPAGYSVEYEYDLFCRIKKIVLKKGGYHVLSPFSGGKYDIYDRLVKYVDADGTEIERKYDFYANLVQLGDSEVYLTKEYKNPLSPYRLSAEMASNNITNQNYLYNNLGWLTDITSKDGTSRFSITYDYSGNVRTFSVRGSLHNCIYQGNRLKEVMSPSGANGYPWIRDAYFEYRDCGAVEGIVSLERVVYFAQDRFFSNKVSKIWAARYADGPLTVSYQYLYDWRGQRYMRLDFLNTNKNLLYCYGAQGQLCVSYSGNHFSDSCIYIYVGNLLISTYDVQATKAYSLVYDQTNTLKYVGYVDHSNRERRIIAYSNPWGEIPRNLSIIPSARFMYNGMEYLDNTAQ